MPNKSQRFQNLKNSLIVFGLITLLIGCFLCAVLTPFALEISKKVAYADSTNGIVEDNLLLNNDCSLWHYTLSGSGNDKLLWIEDEQSFYVYTGYGLTVSGNTFIAPNTTDLQRIYYVVDGLVVGDTYTFTYYMISNSGEYRIRVYQDGSNLYSTYNQTAGLITYSFVCTSSVVRVFSQFRGSATLGWFKLEKSSTFTGYVPNNYTNYGYNQGYDQGVKDTYSKFDTLNGYNILGSPSFVVNDKYIGGSNYIKNNQHVGVFTKLTTGDPPIMFTYQNVDYGFANAYQSPAPPQYFEVYTFGSNYDITFKAGYPTNGYATFPIGDNIAYSGGSIYFCSDVSITSLNLRIIARSVDGTQTVFIDDYVRSGYFNGIPVMDLQNFLVAGYRYNFYLSCKDIETAFNLQSKNTYYTGINSICIVSINDSFVVGNNSYQLGYSDGREAGKQSGYSEGFADGYTKGSLVAPSGGNYSFLGVIGALFDAPINSLKSFLDFDLLGFNMKSFLFAMLTLAFIVLIIRLILGGKSS